MDIANIASEDPRSDARMPVVGKTLCVVYMRSQHRRNPTLTLIVNICHDTVTCM